MDERYYKAVRPGGLNERLLIHARNKIYEDFRGLLFAVGHNDNCGCRDFRCVKGESEMKARI